MKKMILMLMAMVVFGNVMSQTSIIHTDEIVKKCGIGYADVLGAHRQEVWFQGNTGIVYYFKHNNDPILVDRAKTFLAILLSAKSTGSNVKVTSSPADDNDYAGNSSYREIIQINLWDLD